MQLLSGAALPATVLTATLEALDEDSIEMLGMSVRNIDQRITARVRSIETIARQRVSKPSAKRSVKYLVLGICGAMNRRAACIVLQARRALANGEDWKRSIAIAALDVIRVAGAVDVLVELIKIDEDRRERMIAAKRKKAKASATRAKVIAMARTIKQGVPRLTKRSVALKIAALDDAPCGGEWARRLIGEGISNAQWKELCRNA